MGSLVPLDPTAAVFGQSGALAHAFPGYAPRDGQVAMARLVHETTRDGGGCMVDAPCGTGKSLAYLAPTILHALKHEQRVVVATAGIPLQEQLVQKDLPALKRALAPLAGEEWKFALLKGRSNYACKDLVENPAQREEWQAALSEDELAQLREVDRWSRTTETGDRTELPFVVSDSVWRLRSMDQEGCHGKSCDFYAECFARQAHDRAAKATVIVVNYHLLFAHIALKAECGRSLLLPEYQTLVMDEAHEAGDIARDFFGHTLTEGRLKRLAKYAREARGRCREAGVTIEADEVSELIEAADALDAGRAALWDAMESVMRPLLAKEPRVTTLRHNQPLCGDALDALATLTEPLTTVRRIANRVMGRVARMEKVGEAEKEQLRVKRDAERAYRACVKALSWIEHAARSRSPEHAAREPGELDAIHWIAVEERDGRALRFTWESRHVDLAPVLAQYVWGATRAVIACSATMTTGEGPVGWQWIRRQLGAPAPSPSMRTLAVPSPFDFVRQALLCLPREAPDPKRDRAGFDAFVVATLRQVVTAAGGRTLGLFTSTRMAKAAGEGLRVTTRDLGVRLLVQGDAPRSQLVAAFKRDETSVLCGTASLWTGVDVQGASCVVVLIDKLPFAPPGDPVLDALCERAKARTGKDLAGFFEESLPRAVLALRQGVGRLIRATEDWGCVVLCDPRLSSKGYGAEIVRALGMPTRTRSVAEACAWLERGVARMVAERDDERRVGT